MDKFYKSLQAGDTFFESGYGEELELVVTEDTQTVTLNDGTVQYRWKAHPVGSSSIIDYLITEGYEHYGPKVFQ